MIYLVSPTESVLTQRGKRHPNLANYLVEKGEKLFYITSNFYHAEKKVFSQQELNNAKKLISYNIKFIHAGSYQKNISLKRALWCITFSLKVLFFLLKKIKKNDILIIPSRPTELLTVARMLKITKKCKIIVDVEDIWPDAFLINQIVLKKLFYFYCNLHNRFGMKACDVALYVSPNFKNWIVRYHSKTTMVYAPIGVESSYIVKNFKLLDEFPKKIKLLYIGSLQFQINLLPLCEAINKNKNKYQLIIIGENGKSSRYKEVMNYLIKNNINYINKGILPRYEVFNETQKAHIVIVPMISGGLPKKFFDAMGAGKPVLILGQGGAANVVSYYDIGWISDFDPKAIFETLENISLTDYNLKVKNIEKNIHHFSEITSLNTIYEYIKNLSKIAYKN